MVTSLVLNGTHKIGINSSRKIKLNAAEDKEVIVSIDKEVPFIRYRFSEYTDKEISYIKEMMNTFNLSTHLIELNIISNPIEVLEKLKNEQILNIAKYIYIDVDDNVVQNGTIDPAYIDMIGELMQYDIDRYMLKDKSKSLNTVVANNIIKAITTRYNKLLHSDQFGICSSPLSFGESACLTAVKARELMSKYSNISDMAIPSANHQCMNCCGCIRYIEINSDIAAPADGGNTTKKNVNKEKSDTEHKPSVKAKNNIMVGMYSL